MEKTPGHIPRGPAKPALSRREVLAGAAAAAIAVGTRSVSAKPHSSSAGRDRLTPGGQAPVLRYMAAAAVLGDGRVLLTGGYTRPFKEGDTVRPTNTAVIYDPWTGGFTPVAPMTVARARHAAVALKDGRVAVIGGMSDNPTASIEVYDPGANKWTASKPLAQARYDHSAVNDGETVYVMGGSSLAMLTGVEVVYPG